MDFKQMNKHLEELISLKNKLNAMTYDDKDYDDIEEELHDLEDEFLDIYGDYLEGVLDKVHGQLEADNDVLLPIAYIGSVYKEIDKNAAGQRQFEILPDQGVLVESGKVPGKNTRLIFQVNPVRLMFTTNAQQVIVWDEGK
jgi:hypothetical protein